MRRGWRWLRKYWLGIVIAIFVGFGFASLYGNWSAFSALATLVLALAAFWSIRENRRIRDEDRKERLLNEIIEWAVDIATCGSEKKFTDMTSIKDVDQLFLFNRAFAAELMLSFEAMIGKSQYISKVALTFGQDFEKTVEELIRDLKLHVDLLDQYQQILADKTGDTLLDKIASTVKKIGEHNLQLGKSTNRVIEEAVKIKSRHISRS